MEAGEFMIKMENVALLAGGLLVAIGFAGYSISDVKSMTAFIPSGIGLIFLAVGIVVILKPGTRKHAMHVAAMVALLGLLAVGGRGLMGLSSMNLAKGISFGGSVVVLLAFLVLAIRSFIEARRARENSDIRPEKQV
jgi:peptidoglycan/LPS O-acetylase OafA/YrhL